MNRPSPSVPLNPAIRWRKGELIGVGAFGSVYMGMNLDSGELFAVKQVFVSSNSATRHKAQAHLRELEEEVKLLKNLSHPNIVRYLGTARDDNTLNIFLEFVPGGSIASLLSKFGPFPEMVIRMYTRQLLQGLEYLHKNAIMHRDIKGANILVDNKGCIKLADFGSSKQVVELVTTAGSKSIKGTPYWMAPEVIRQTGHNLSADIWSVGCTVIEMATGKAPWSQQFQEVAALFHIGTTKSHPPIPEHLSHVAHDFLLKCLEQEPDLRPTASELLEHPFVKIEGVPATLCTSQGSDLSENCKRRQLSPNKIEEPCISGSSIILAKDHMSLKISSPDIRNGLSKIDFKSYMQKSFESASDDMIWTQQSSDQPPAQDSMDNPQDAEDGICNFASPDIFRNTESPVARTHEYSNQDTTFFSFKHMPTDENDEEDDEEITEAKIKAFLEEKAMELKRLQTPLYVDFHSSWNAQQNQDASTITSCRDQRRGTNNIIAPQSCSWASSSSKTPSKDNSSSGVSTVQSSGSEPSISSQSCDRGNKKSNFFSYMDASRPHEMKENFMETQEPSYIPSIPSSADRLKLWKEELQLELKMRRDERRLLSGVAASPKASQQRNTRSLKRKQP